MVKISDILARMPNCKARVADLVLQLDTDDQFSLLGQDVEELSDIAVTINQASLINPVLAIAAGHVPRHCFSLIARFFSSEN